MLWSGVQVWRRRRIWKKRSRTNLIRDPGFRRLWENGFTDQFLLEQVERYGKNLAGRLRAVVEEHSFVYGLSDGVDWDGGESDLQDWSESLDELIDRDLVVRTDGEYGEEYALTHVGRSQLHSLRSAAQNSRRLKVAIKSLRIAVAALVVGVILQLIGLLYQTGLLGGG